MNRLIQFVILWSIAIAIASAQETATPKDEGNPSPSALIERAEATIPSAAKAIVLVIDADAQQSEVVKQVVEALEKAGIAKSQAAETTPPASSLISVTLRMRKDESYDKIKQLIEAIKGAGVHQMSIREGGVQYQGKEINELYMDLQRGYSPAEYEKIDLAAIAVMDQCGLSLLRARSFEPEEEERHTLSGAKLPVLDSSERTDQPMNSGFFPKASQIADLRTDYEAANKQAHDLATSLRQTPDATKKAELRTAVQRAFTLRQSLLRAELLEMQARLERTQQSLDLRDRIADQIVDRRVEDLLNPQLEWEGSPQSTRAEQSSPAERASTAVPGLSNPPSPIEPVAEVSDDTQLDQTQTALLAKLQGFWDFQELSVENPEPRHFPNGPPMIYEIVGNRMASPPSHAQMPEWYL